MTKIKIERGERRVTVEISGHAKYNPGNDIVCAAASMLASTFAQYAQKLFKAGVIEQMLAFEYTPSRVYVDYIIGDKATYQVMSSTLLDVLKTGYELLEEQYPKNVKALH